MLACALKGLPALACRSHSLTHSLTLNKIAQKPVHGTTIAIAQFTTAVNAMKFIRGQRFNQKMREHKLWASENRTPEERRRCKIVNKIKRAFIEHGRFDPKNVLVSYKSFSARIRMDKGFMNVANVKPDGIIEWLGDDGVVNSDVKEAMAEFVEMLE